MGRCILLLLKQFKKGYFFIISLISFLFFFFVVVSLFLFFFFFCACVLKFLHYKSATPSEKSTTDVNKPSIEKSSSMSNLKNLIIVEEVFSFACLSFALLFLFFFFPSFFFLFHFLFYFIKFYLILKRKLTTSTIWCKWSLKHF